MTHPIRIRPERPSDVQAISRITELAFRSHPHSQRTEHFIIEALRAAGALTVSLVAVQGAEEVVGHIAFSQVAISDGSTDWYALGPIAVTPGHQGQGIGRALVDAGLAALRDLDAAGCVLVGEPDFYGRFGFRSDPVCTMDGIPQAYVLSLPFKGRQAVGTIGHHAAFQARG